MSLPNLSRLFTFILALFLLKPSLAIPQTPKVFLNEKIRLVELAKSQRATLRFDLRPIRGKHLKVMLFAHDQTLDEKPVKEWLFHQSTGQERLSFRDLPRKLYTLVAFCSNAEGEQLAYAAPVVHVEYGDWRAWEEFKPPVETIEKDPDGFEDIGVSTAVRNQEVGISLSPPAIVIHPGASQTFRAQFKNIKPEALQWKLIGEGKLRANKDGSYTYRAPAKLVEKKLFRIEVYSSSHPDLKGGATILFSDARQDQI